MKRCQFFIEHKNRPCRFHVVPGKDYCGQHLYFVTGEGKKRIPCPLNPGHHILEEDLKRHLKICSAQLRLEEGQRELTYRQDVNLPPIDSPSLPSGGSRSESRSAYAQSLGPQNLLSLISRVLELSEGWVEPGLQYRIPEACQGYLKPDGRRPFKLKHALQQASITGIPATYSHFQSSLFKGQLMQRGVFDGEVSPLVIEFGAGKAYLSSMISDCTHATDYILVDNQAFKHKAERTMRSDASLNIQRIRMDLKDFDLRRLPELNNGVPWVALGKHLCGGSTDFAIRAFQQASQEGQKRDLSQGLFVATCCHHRCDWASFSARETFKQHGFNKEDFELISWMTGHSQQSSPPLLESDSGWALCDHQASSDLAPVLTEQSVEELRVEMEAMFREGVPPSFWRFFPKDFRVLVGLKCKWLIDRCRMEWLQNQGFNAELTLYVPTDISPENKFLAVRP